MYYQRNRSRDKKLTEGEVDLKNLRSRSSSGPRPPPPRATPPPLPKEFENFAAAPKSTPTKPDDKDKLRNEEIEALLDELHKPKLDEQSGKF